MPKPNSIYSYNLGKANGLGSSGEVYSFTNRQNGGLGPAAYFPNRNVVAPIIQTPVVTQLTEYKGDYDGEYYIALLFYEATYLIGITNIVDLIRNQFPNTKLIFVKYIINKAITNIESNLQEFITLYPRANKVVVSELSSVINRTTAFINSRNLNILSLSISATSLAVMSLKNAISYGYYVSKQIPCCYSIMKDYGIKNIVVLNEKTSPNTAFFTSWRDTFYKQNNLLDKYPVLEYDVKNNSDTSLFDIANNSIVVILAETITIKNNLARRVINSFHNNTSSFIYITNINKDLEDVFEHIPAMVAVLVPSLYTATTDLVYKSVQDIDAPHYGVYSLYDIFYTLNYCANNKIFITKKTYINANPFTEISPAWSYGNSIDEKTNNFLYGAYDMVFTKDSVIDNNRVLYDIHNQNASLARLPNSRSIFKSVGVFPNLPTPLVYLDRNYIKIYQDGILKYVKFDTNNTITNENNIINSSNACDCKFIVAFDRVSYLLKYLKKIFDNKKLTYTEVNLTMYKSIVTKYIESDNIVSFDSINAQLIRDNNELIYANNNILELEGKLAQLLYDYNNQLYATKEKISAANSKKLEAMIAISKNEELLASIQEI